MKQDYVRVSLWFKTESKDKAIELFNKYNKDRELGIVIASLDKQGE